MRVVIGGPMDGKTKVDIAAGMNMDRSKASRMIKTLREFANAA